MGKEDTELFIPKEKKLATDLETQITWLAWEMGYSRDKTAGYEEKIIRLGRDTNDPQSTFGFMNNYWLRFTMQNQYLEELGQPMVGKVLQAHAKVVAGLCDKVALSLWLADKNQPQDALVKNALTLVKQSLDETEKPTQEELERLLNKPFEANPMGKAILALHTSFTKDSSDTNALKKIALDGSVKGLRMFQTYTDTLTLANRYGEVILPKPGLSSGNIEVWE